MSGVAKGWHLNWKLNIIDTETPDRRCDYTFLLLPSPVTPETRSFHLFSYGLCRSEIFTGSHCFSLDPFSSVRLLQLGIISYCISSIVRWDIIKHRALTQLIRIWKRKDGNNSKCQSQSTTADQPLWEALEAPAHSLRITSPSLCAHISQPPQRHSSKRSSSPAEQTVPRMNLSGHWKALHKLGLISSYTASSAWRHQLKEHIKGWIWFFKKKTVNN